MLFALLAVTVFGAPAADAEEATKGCVVAPTSPLVVNVRDKGAKGDGRTDGPFIYVSADGTAAIMVAIEVIKIGRRRVGPARSMASRAGSPSLRICVA